MLRSLAAALALALPPAIAAPAPAAADSASNSPLGRWLTDAGKGHVEIYQCGAKLCGRIVWLREPTFPSGEPKTDRKNPDPALRTRPIVGLEMMWGFVPSGDPGEWESGRIYNPEEGETYKATLKLRPDGRLQLRGYVGISLLGKTQYWDRVR